MMSGYGADLTLTIEWICKTRNVVLYSARTLVLWMIVLATIDRWLSSSVIVHLRRLSSVKNARRSMSIVLLYTCFINTPILYCYEANLTGVVRGCYGSTYIYRLTTDLIYAFGTTLLPLLSMIIFGLLTIRNVRHTQNRVLTVTGVVISLENRKAPTTRNGPALGRKKDRHLLTMLFVQVTLLFLFTCAHAIEKVYSSFASSSSSPSLQTSIENLMFNVFTLLAFTASGMPFYIYTLTGGSLLCNALLSLIKAIVREFLCH